MLRQLCTLSFQTLNVHNCQLVPRSDRCLAASVQQLHDSKPEKQYETILSCWPAGRFHSNN